MTNYDVALACAKAGLPVIPAKLEFNEKKGVWDKKPLIGDWPNSGTTDLKQIETWFKFAFPFPNVVPGISLGQADLVAIDCDRHPGGEDGIATFEELQQKYKQLPPHPICSTAGGGEHHILRQMPGMKLGNSEGDLPGGINVRGVGGFIVAPGSIRPDGKMWVCDGWPDVFHNGGIPIIPDWLVLKLRPRESTPTEARPHPNGKAPPIGAEWTAEREAEVDAALACIPSDKREVWFRVCAALHSTGWPSAREKADQWSNTSFKYDEDEQEKLWRSFDRGYGRDPIKLATLFEIAIEHGWKDPGAAIVSAPDAEPDLRVMRLSRRQAVPFPIDVLGEKWSAWAQSAAESVVAPVDYVAAALLASASALIGNARWAQAWPGWEEPPHVWMCCVGDSGDGKSPGMDAIGKTALPEIESRMALDFPDQLQEARKNIEIAKAKMDSWKADIKTAISSGKLPPAAPAEIPEEPVKPRLVMDDVTHEKVALVLARAAPKGVLMFRDELAGFLLGMNAYSDQARPFWLEAYGGRFKVVDRVKHPEPIKVERLVVSFLGGIQPERLAEVMQKADDGLLARFNYFWPEPVLFRRPTRVPDIPWAIMAFDRLRCLEMTNNPLDPSRSKPLMVRLEDPAADLLTEFGASTQRQKDMTAGLMKSAIGKARGLALRLSLVIEYLSWCARDGYAAPPHLISKASVEAAIRLISNYLLPMAERTYGDAACPVAERSAALLARWIAKERPKAVHVRTMQREIRLHGLTTAETIHAACLSLVEAGWLEKPSQDGKLGRKMEAYPVSPRLFTLVDTVDSGDTRGK